MCDRDASEMQNLSEDFNRRHARPIRPRTEEATATAAAEAATTAVGTAAQAANDSGIHAGLFPLSWARPMFSRLHHLGEEGVAVVLGGAWLAGQSRACNACSFLSSAMVVVAVVRVVVAVVATRQFTFVRN